MMLRSIMLIGTFGISFFGGLKLVHYFSRSGVSSLKKKAKKYELKMVVVVRKDLKISKSEIVALCSRAFLESYRKKVNETNVWSRLHGAKLALKVKNEAELNEIQKTAALSGLTHYLVKSSAQQGLALAIGPNEINAVNAVTSHLKLY